MDQVARENRGSNSWVRGIGVPERIRHGVQVVQIAEILVEPVYRRQKLIQVAEVVLAELPRLVALLLEGGGYGRGLRGKAYVGTGLPDGRHTRADRQLAGDEVRPPRRATRLGVIVSEPHALRGQLIEIRRLARHYALVIRTDVEPADVIAHNDDDIGFLVRRLRRGEDAQ